MHRCISFCQFPGWWSRSKEARCDKHGLNGARRYTVKDGLCCQDIVLSWPQSSTNVFGAALQTLHELWILLTNSEFQDVLASPIHAVLTVPLSSGLSDGLELLIT